MHHIRGWLLASIFMEIKGENGKIALNCSDKFLFFIFVLFFVFFPIPFAIRKAETVYFCRVCLMSHIYLYKNSCIFIYGHRRAFYCGEFCLIHLTWWVIAKLWSLLELRWVIFICLRQVTPNLSIGCETEVNTLITHCEDELSTLSGWIIKTLTSAKLYIYFLLSETTF